MLVILRQFSPIFGGGAREGTFAAMFPYLSGFSIWGGCLVLCSKGKAKSQAWSYKAHLPELSLGCFCESIFAPLPAANKAAKFRDQPERFCLRIPPLVSDFWGLFPMESGSSHPQSRVLKTCIRFPLEIALQGMAG